MINIKHKYLLDVAGLLTAENISNKDDLNFEGIIDNYMGLMGGEKYTAPEIEPDSILTEMTMLVINEYVDNFNPIIDTKIVSVFDDSAFSEKLKAAGDLDNSVFNKIQDAIRTNGFVEGIRLAAMIIPTLKGDRLDPTSIEEFARKAEDILAEIEVPSCLATGSEEMSFTDARAMLNSATNTIIDSRYNAFELMNKSFSNAIKRAENYPKDDIFVDGSLNKLTLKKAISTIDSLTNPLSALRVSGCVKFDYTPILVEAIVDGKEYSLGSVMRASLGDLSDNADMSDVLVVSDEPIGQDAKLGLNMVDINDIPDFEITNLAISKQMKEYQKVITKLYDTYVKNPSSDPIKDAIMLALVTHYSSSLVAMLGTITKFNGMLIHITKEQNKLVDINSAMNRLFLEIVK